MKYLILLLLITGCTKYTVDEGKRPQSEFMMTPERIEYGMYRYENKEVLCYVFYDTGVSCKWKEGE